MLVGVFFLCCCCLFHAFIYFVNWTDIVSLTKSTKADMHGYFIFLIYWCVSAAAPHVCFLLCSGLRLQLHYLYRHTGQPTNQNNKNPPITCLCFCFYFIFYGFLKRGFKV